jgi:hypothetical protein
MTTKPDNARAPTEANATTVTNPDDTKTPAEALETPQEETQDGTKTSLPDIENPKEKQEDDTKTPALDTPQEGTQDDIKTSLVEALETPKDKTQDGTKTPVNPNKSSEPIRLSKANCEGKKRVLKRKTHRSAVDLGRVLTNSSTGDSMNITRRKTRRRKKSKASPEMIELGSDSKVEEVTLKEEVIVPYAGSLVTHSMGASLGIRQSPRASSEVREPFRTYADSKRSFRTNKEAKVGEWSGDISSSFQSKKKRRNSMRHKKPKASPEMIELEGVEETITKTKYRFDLVRIAVGKKVFLSGCELLCDVTTGIMELSYKRAKRRSSSIGLDTNPDRGTVRFSPSSKSSEEFAYYSDVEDGSTKSEKPSSSAQDDLFSFISMNIKPDESNNLSTFSSAYKPKSSDEYCKYIVLEFRSDTEMHTVLAMLRTEPEFAVDMRELTLKEEVLSYAGSLVTHSKKLKKKSPKERSAFINGRNSEHIILVYPFGGDSKEIEAAVEDLNEASGMPADNSEDSCGDEQDKDSLKHEQNELAKIENESSGEEKKSEHATASTVRQRAHFVTIRVEDYERLDPGEWLNDSLVDLWMQW